jgi:hypothetical protein
MHTQPPLKIQSFTGLQATYEHFFVLESLVWKALELLTNFHVFHFIPQYLPWWGLSPNGPRYGFGSHDSKTYWVDMIFYVCHNDAPKSMS